jgi:FkbM family methyltransferase
MWVDEPGSAKNSLNPKWVETLRTDAKRFGSTLQFNEQKEVETITLEQMIARHGRPFYIKIDVEGYEPMVLKGLTERRLLHFIRSELPEFQPEASNVSIAGRFGAAGRIQLRGGLPSRLDS